MAGAKLKVELEGMPEVLAMFNRLVELGERPRPALVDLGEYLKIRTEERFRAETAPGGAKWAPLAPARGRPRRGRSSAWTRKTPRPRCGSSATRSSARRSPPAASAARFPAHTFAEPRARIA